MIQDNFDNKISEVLHERTHKAASLKDSTFIKIKNKINKIEKGENKVIMKRKSRLPKIASITFIVSIILITLISTTEQGQAAIGKIKEFFSPQKTVEQQLEGNEEETEMILQENMDYIIYIDESLYKMESQENIDTIVPINSVDTVPEVSMSVEQIKDTTPEQLEITLINDLTSQFNIVENKGKVDSPVPAILLYAREGDDWNSVIVKYYLIDNTKGGTFLITQKYFLEASEGHGVRLDNMLKEFKIIPLNEIQDQ